jgi:ubiquinone/menaquinone biosynthesis C-methylase UbiE
MRRARHRWGDFSELNRRWVTSRSTTTHERLQADPTEWFAYHTLYREARKDWPEVPYESFVAWLRARPHLVVGDFGCGEAELAKALPNTVHSFDHVAIDERVIACDMAHAPLEDGVLDVAIFSLSLMGTNIEDYLCEAHRLLKLDGRLRIAETASRWQGDKRAELLGMIGTLGFRLIGTVEERDRFLYIDAIKA